MSAAGTRALPALLAACFAFTLARLARADLTDDADRLARLWTLHGARVDRLPSIFVEHGRPRAVMVRPSSSTDASSGCLTIAFVSVRTAELQVAEDASLGGHAADLSPKPPASHGPAPDAAALPGPSLFPQPAGAEARDKSAGGVLTLARCGPEQDALRRVTVEMLSPRAAVELLVARSDTPLPEPREILPERAVGPLAPRGDAGGALEPGPLEARLARAERRAKDDGAAHVARLSMTASPNGSGRFSVRLSEGCHRVELMAAVPATFPHRATDLDAEARDEAGRLLARDRADVPDARLDFCLGEPTVVEVSYLGAAEAVAVTLADAHWSPALEVPSHWGARAKAGFSWALFRHHAPAPREGAIVEALGVQGGTRLPLEVEPGRCYLAAVALVRGEARMLRLSAATGGRAPHDEGTESPSGAAVAFCSGTATSANVEVDARGNGVWWALAVWPMGSSAP